jgi:hypothetical protein
MKAKKSLLVFEQEGRKSVGPKTFLRQHGFPDDILNRLESIEYPHKDGNIRRLFSIEALVQAWFQCERARVIHELNGSAHLLSWTRTALKRQKGWTELQISQLPEPDKRGYNAYSSYKIWSGSQIFTPPDQALVEAQMQPIPDW